MEITLVKKRQKYINYKNYHFQAIWRTRQKYINYKNYH